MSLSGKEITQQDWGAIRKVVIRECVVEREGKLSQRTHCAYNPFRPSTSQLNRREDFAQAYAAMQEMRTKIPNVNMAYYVNVSVIENIHRALGIPMGRGRGAEVNDDEVADDSPL